MSPGKPITPKGLARDLEYVLEGTIYHEAFYDVCPPREWLQVLEPGCGSGKFSAAYALRGADVVSLDIDPGVIEYTWALFREMASWAREHPASFPHYTGALMTIQVGSIHELTTLFPKERFDFVFNEGVPHHWPREDPRRQGAIDQMAAVTKPGGKVALMVSNAHCPDMMRYAATVKHTYHSMPERQVPFSQDELLEALMRAGLQHVGVRPVESDALERARTLLAYGTKG